eukprot:s886_g13.t1
MLTKLRGLHSSVQGFAPKARRKGAQALRGKTTSSLPFTGHCITGLAPSLIRFLAPMDADKESAALAQERFAELEAMLIEVQKKFQAAVEDSRTHNITLQMECAREQEKAKEAENKVEQLQTVLANEWAKREVAEKEREALHKQLMAMSQTSELAVEKEMRAAAEGQCVSLQGELNSMSQKVLELEAQMQMKNNVSGLRRGVTWQYYMDGTWEEFTPEANEQMNQAYLDYLREILGSQHITICSGGVARQVDFYQMQQTHLTTGKTRRIRVSAGVPPRWVAPAPDLLQQGNDLRSFYKEVADPEIWDSIRYILQNTGHAQDQYTLCSCMSKAEIISVHRIENMRLWHRYKTRLAAMREDHATSSISVGSAELDLDGYGNIMAQSQETFDCGEPLALDVDEKILLHGTSWHNANSIVREGFDHRTCQNAFYGAGVYFACAACKSHQYTCRMGSICKCERTLIIARVALGDSYVATETRKTDRRPPIRSGASGTYDSIVVKPGPIRTSSVAFEPAKDGEVPMATARKPRSALVLRLKPGGWLHRRSTEHLSSDRQNMRGALKKFSASAGALNNWFR